MQADPTRKERILQAALESVAKNGVAGTTHRKIAALANVPVGSLTYHFTDLTDILHQAFAIFAEQVSAQTAVIFARARTVEELLSEIVALVHGQTTPSSPTPDTRSRVIAYELYTLAAREPEFRTITKQWMQASRDSLERLLRPARARAVDAYIEGVGMHIALDPTPQTPADTLEALTLLTREN